MQIRTADLTDQHADAQIAAPVFDSFGGKTEFSGIISTVRCFEDNSFVRQALETPGERGVLVVDGGGSLKCALLGDILAEMAHKNDWTGLVIYGCVRDTTVLRTIDIGVRALAACPLKSVKRNVGERDVVVSFAGVEFTPGHHLYADSDGIIVSERAL